MIHAIRALRREGATAVTLGVRSENGPAVGLYRGLGFEVVEEEEMWQRAVP
jgi:ribosomal protein S18 acetylase RimI-like enzyme